MCLILDQTNNSGPSTAVNDITVYKVLRAFLRTERRDIFASPFRLDRYKLNEYKTDLSFQYRSEYNTRGNICVDRGLHTFANIDDAKIWVKSNFVENSINLFVVHATIPTGSLYYKGIFKFIGNVVDSYASNNLKIGSVAELEYI